MTSSVPLAWDGTDAGLGPGIDATLAAAFELRAGGGPPTAVSALAAEIPPRHQGRHLSAVLLTAMADLARQAGLSHLIAPVRPNRKDRYPTIPIERYTRWAGHPAFSAHHRDRRPVGSLDGHAVPGDRRLHLPRGPGPGAHRPGP
jgi:hypothetical protein